MDVGAVFIIVILSLPILAILYYTAAFPRDAALWGRRWQYQNDNLEPSEDAIKYNKFCGIIGIAVVLAFDIGCIISCFMH